MPLPAGGDPAGGRGSLHLTVWFMVRFAWDSRGCLDSFPAFLGQLAMVGPRVQAGQTAVWGGGLLRAPSPC